MAQAAFPAVLDSSQMMELVESMGDVLAAAGNLTLRFKVTVEFAEGATACAASWLGRSKRGSASHWYRRSPMRGPAAIEFRTRPERHGPGIALVCWRPGFLYDGSIEFTAD
jgi:hypothetical protein